MEGFETRNSTEVEAYQHHLDEILVEVNQLEERVGEVEQFYDDMSKMQLNAPAFSSLLRNGRQSIGKKKQQKMASEREAAAANRMQELMSHFATILNQITKHRWACPFMKPVDAKRLGLHDYYEVIEKPMDFTTIKTRMEAKDGSGYKNVRDICEDVRLVFENAKKYNDEKNSVHVMAKNLSAKFEESWRQIEPKAIEEERRREQEEAEAQLFVLQAKEVEHAQMARDIRHELSEVEANLEELKESVLQKCRKLSVPNKVQLVKAFPQLSVEDMMKAIKIIAPSHPDHGSHCGDECVDVDLTTENESAAWSLKLMVDDALELQSKNVATSPVNTTGLNRRINSKKKNTNCKGNANKRKKQIYEAIAKSAKRRCTRPS